MFNRLGICLPLLAVLALGAAGQTKPAAGPRPAPARPKLVLAIVLDQFRYEYIERFRDQYNGGFHWLLNNGASLTDAHYHQMPTVTAVGHSIFLSGSMPSVSGIIDNEWYDHAARRRITSVSDPGQRLLGASGEAASPHRMLVTTVGDQLKLSSGGVSKVFGVSAKDRSAILPAGRMADGAFWFDDSSGNFVSSTWYSKQLPDWVESFNKSRHADVHLGAAWRPLDHASTPPFLSLAASAGSAYYKAFGRTPFANDLLELFVEGLLEEEKLGRRGQPDLLAVSFSANDYVGHDYGPYSAQVRDMCLRTDRLLGRLFKFIDARVGLAGTLIVLSSDHGVSPVPEQVRDQKLSAGRIKKSDLWQMVTRRLNEDFGRGDWILGDSTVGPYLNHALISEKRRDPAEVMNRAAALLRTVPGVARVYTREQLWSAGSSGDPIDVRVRNGYHPSRSADLVLVLEPYWLFDTNPANHFQPYSYDTHVPVLFVGRGVRRGRFNRHASVSDVAPTLSLLLGIEAPSGSQGRVLDEILE